MAAKKSQPALNKFAKNIDEFKAKFAKLINPQTRAQVYASGNQKMISDYETAVVRGNALNRSINALVGAWDAFKRGYKAVTDQTSMVIGDAIDEIRSWFGYKPAGGIGCYGMGNVPPMYGEDVLSVGKPLDIDAHLYGQPLGGLGAIQLAAIPASIAVAGVISAALILNSLMDKIFVSIEATRIQKENPKTSKIGLYILNSFKKPTATAANRR